MSTYKGIFGKTIKHLSSDPDNSTYEGQIWYNTTEGKFKTVLATAAWSSGSPVSEARRTCGSAVQSGRDAAIMFAGYQGTADSAKTEEYDGSGWSTATDVNTARNASAGFGTQTAAVMAGGYDNGPNVNVSNVEEYNGSTWTEVTDIPAARRGMANAGTLTAGIVAGGVDTASNSTVVLEYDGTNWTTGTAIPTGQDRLDAAGAGTQTAFFMAAGDNRTSWQYDGSSWTSGPSTSSDHDGGSDAGIQTAALTFGGFLSPGSGQVTSTEVWDGTSFSTSPASMATGRYGMARSGSTSGNTSVLGAGGDTNPGLKTDTEEYNFTANTITADAWASGGAMSAGSGQGAMATAGSKNSFLAAMGGPGARNDTEEYDGSSWTAGGTVPYSASGVISFGTQTVAVAAGGQPGGGGVNTTAEYNGSSWSNQGNLPYNQLYQRGGAGNGADGISVGGWNQGSPTGGSMNDVKVYDGSSWSTPATAPFSRYSATHYGTGSPAVNIVGGYGPPSSPGQKSDHFGFDGTSFTTLTSLPVARVNAGAAGTQTAGFIFGGSAPSQVSSSLQWDGTSWITSTSLPTAIDSDYSGGTSTTAISAGGNAPPYTTATNEYEEGSTSINIESVDNS